MVISVSWVVEFCFWLFKKSFIFGQNSKYNSKLLYVGTSLKDVRCLGKQVGISSKKERTILLILDLSREMKQYVHKYSINPKIQKSQPMLETLYYTFVRPLKVIIQEKLLLDFWRHFEFCIDNSLIVKVVCFSHWNCDKNC